MEFHRLYELYFKDIYRYIFSKSNNESISEEIAQETFYRVLEKIEDFDEKELQNIPDDINFVDQIINRDMASQIHRFVENLSNTYRDVFTLRVYGEMSFDEVGRLYGKSAVWARVTYVEMNIEKWLML